MEPYRARTFPAPAERGTDARQPPARRPIWLRILIWPLRLLGSMARSMALFVLVTGLPFVVLMRKLSLVWIVLAVAGFASGVPALHASLMLVAGAVSWLFMDAWNWALYRLLPEDDVLIAPYH
ncbi:hypothetical protein EV667_4066 [Ancylobacter aquaticus]|uniref:Uncharacterized protein n=2 Tax=Ancylobacter aquaticus TaxID=100 RepID=A0A4R1HDL1_ANCAQ|nr:hypothetical protein EV667_4066 [Ancylobacter aquaticus]